MIFCNKVKYTKNFISKWRKKELRVFRYSNVKVVALNDYKNRRVLVWYYIEASKKIMRVAYHGYFAKHLARRIGFTVNLINTNDNYREYELFARRSFSQKAEFKWSKRG